MTRATLRVNASKESTTPNVASSKAIAQKKSSKSDAKADSISEAILSTMVAVQLKRNTSRISFVALMKARKMNDRNTPWRKEWRLLIDEGYIRPVGNHHGIFTSDHELTDLGEDRSGSPNKLKEIQRLLETPEKTTAEHHAKIRKLCMNNRAVQTFDLLLKHGSLTRKELAATIGISDRGGPFSYGLRHLKQLGFIVVAKISRRGKKKLVLSDKAFVKPEDRPEPIPIDPKTMSENMEKVYGKEMRKAAAARSKVEIEATIEHEAQIITKTESDYEESTLKQEVFVKSETNTN